MLLTLDTTLATHLEQLSFAQPADLNTKLRQLLAAEYHRRLARYRLTVAQMTQKYQMAFEEFEQQQMTAQKGYAWEVEADAMTWETAFDGVQTMQRLLQELAQSG